MKAFLALFVLTAGTGLMQGAIVETISLDLSPLNPGSILSGSFTLSDSPADGDTAPVILTFNDPANYSPTSLSATISILSGTPTGFAVDFSQLSFTNLNGVTTPINTRDVILNRFAFANCASFPCTATGGFEDRSPAVFRSTYTIAPAAAAQTPEPNYGLLVPMLLAGLAYGRRLIRQTLPDRLP